MRRNLFFYPLSHYHRIRPNWCFFEIDEQAAPGGQISGSSLRILISQHAAFHVPPSNLDLVLHNVSSDEYKDLRDSMTGYSTIDFVRITAAPTISSYDIVSLSSCPFIIAIHSPVPVHVIPSTSQPLPTLQNTPQAELPASVRLPQFTEDPLTQSNIELLLPSVLVRVCTNSAQSMSMDDCTSNSVQTPSDPVPSCPGWVTSFIREMSRRREIPTVGFHSLLQLAQGLDDAHLVQSIHARFVSNDGTPINTSMGQQPLSRSFELSGYQTTLSSSATHWTDDQVMQLFAHNFGGNGSRRTNMGLHQLTLIRNEPLPWGLGIPISVTPTSENLWYRFKPGLAIVRGVEPYVLLEFESQNNDFARLLLYGSSLVRWISRVCTYRCILPLCFIHKTGETELLYMYELDNKIQYVKQLFSLNSLRSRLEFFVTIFNITDREPIQGLYETLRNNIAYLRSAIPKTGFSTSLPDNNNKDEDKDEDVNLDDVTTVRELSQNRSIVDDVGMDVSEDRDDSDVICEDVGGVRKAGRRRTKGGKRERKGPYGGRPKRSGGGPKDDDSGGVSTRSQAKGNSCTAQDILVRAGYVTVMDTGKDIISVAKKSQNFIVKVIRNKNEKKFYSMRITHPNIIRPEEVISTCDWYLVILPKLVSLSFALDPHSSATATSKLQEMSYDLANGLHFLHRSGIAHLDIKPDNLVYHHKTFVLQIIDFNSAVWVKNVDEKISGYRGTLAWMAPEIMRGIPFNPIAADRFSCGIVFHQLARIAKEAGVRECRLIELRSFASQLLNVDPCLRPSLGQYACNSS